MGFYLK